MLTGQLPAGRFDPPPVAADAVMRVLDNDPGKRFRDADEMAAALASPGSTHTHRWKIGLGAAAIIATLCFAIWPGKGGDNALGIRFVPLAGSEIEFSQWETRVSDYAAFVAATGHQPTDRMFSFDTQSPRLALVQKDDRWDAPGFEQSADHPVVGVSLTDAIAFCEWFTESERAAGRLNEGHCYRLPTEREWSLASGVNEIPADDTYGGGANRDLADFLPWDEQAPPPPGSGNFADTSAARALPGLTALQHYDDGHPVTAPVADQPTNAAGIQGMLGNVWEWTAPSESRADNDATFRGGSWTTGAFRHYLPGLRMRWSGDLRRNDIGFRIVRAPIT